MRFRSRGSYIAVGIWCLMAVVLANAYGGVLFSFLTVGKLEQPINSVEEVSTSDDVHLISLRGVAITNRFLVQYCFKL